MNFDMIKGLTSFDADDKKMFQVNILFLKKMSIFFLFHVFKFIKYFRKKSCYQALFLKIPFSFLSIFFGLFVTLGAGSCASVLES